MIREMIRTESDYRAALERVRDHETKLANQVRVLIDIGMAPAEAKQALEPLREELRERQTEIQAYERLRRGDLGVVNHLGQVGQLLVMARVSAGVSQRQLAERMEVDPSQVSRDERTAYSGVTLDRAVRILEALGVEVSIEARWRRAEVGVEVQGEG